MNKPNDRLSVFAVAGIDWRRVGVNHIRASVGVYVLDVRFKSGWQWTAKHGTRVFARGQAQSVAQAKRRALGQIQPQEG